MVGCSLRSGFTSRAQIKAESKDDMRWRGTPSPDGADRAPLAL